ncbi:MAG: four helix bundle protein [Candidatus Omnitrophica bacterium]|nr:four helix bundle protein [Candidatus Omnitrophota bacterium]
MRNTNARIVSFQDLEVFQNSYRASLTVMTRVIPRLPDVERDDLKPQLRRSCKAIPRLIAEGFAKRHQRYGFQKYLYDAVGECNENVVSLSHCRDLYGSLIGDEHLLVSLIDLYDKSARQPYKLTEAWNSFQRDKRQP